MKHDSVDQAKTSQPPGAVRVSASVRSRRQQPAALAAGHPLLHLQRSLGNRAVTRLVQTQPPFESGFLQGKYSQCAEADRGVLSERGFQAKPIVSLPNDPYEQEADHVADRVVDHALHPAEPPATRGDGSAEGATLRRLVSPPGPPALGGLGPGAALSRRERAFFEPRFGADFAGVRLHTGPRAQAAADGVGARAFNVGQSIVFARDQYGPDSRLGRRLLAHELTHVVQRGLAGSIGDIADGISLSAAPPAGVIARAVAPDYQTIADNLSYGLFDWVIRDKEAHDVLVILQNLSVSSKEDFADTIARMEADGYVTRLIENVSGKDRTKFAPLIQSIQEQRSTGAITAHSEDLLSRGFFDWAITDEDARLALENLKSLRPSPDRLKRVVRIIRGKQFRRLFDQLSDRDREANKAFLKELEVIRETGLTHQDARDYFEAFRLLSEAEQKSQFNKDYPIGHMGNAVKALPPAAAAGKYRDEVRRILRWAQEEETRKAAGLSDEEMAKLQAKFMETKDRASAERQAEEDRQKRARERVASGLPKEPSPPPRAPTPQEMKAARERRVSAGSIEQKTEEELKRDKKNKAEMDAWKARAKAVIPLIAALAQVKYPELGVTAANFRADFESVEGRGKSVFAHTGRASDGTRQVVFGYEFVRAAEVDPAYVMSVVAHELYGHLEYGPTGAVYLLRLYDQAAAKTAGYTRPTGKERRTEIDNFAYQGTEIYSLLRSLPYHTPIRAEDAARRLVEITPKSTVRYRITLIQKHWEPTLAIALVRGLYVRFKLDPRITPEALSAFEAGVRSVFKKKDVKAILE